MPHRRKPTKNVWPPANGSVSKGPEPQAGPAETSSTYVQFLQTRAAEVAGPARSPFICVWLKGVETPLALSQPDAVKFLASLARSLATQRHRIARRVAAAWSRWESEENQRRATLHTLKSSAGTAPPPGKEWLVSRDALEATYREVVTAGPSVSLDFLLRQVEPDLAAFLEARAMALQDELCTSRRARSDLREAVVAISTAAVVVLRKAHYRLWLDSTIGTRLAHLDPDLVDGPRNGE